MPLSSMLHTLQKETTKEGEITGNNKNKKIKNCLIPLVGIMKKYMLKIF